ncbi:TPA: NAD(P)-dependent oxidoreductase [Candidatus Thalassarchaeaceae archaeon]|jgi:nucleoside-diphosphate-sugar epimerase|nr:NAD(P)-dependent oxidoreductase [Euryarchaeota archaeon]MDG1547814.1 NAD(P)-dependent oxidoreductase [Candidatus Thalassarchaeaceae archaeon]DAC63202.1 MAG TPA: NAD(P)-dependent oxidoreductase [Candidatus Poseidoniales archaeon]MBT3847470.1 NAD(P)-dependent oxidoreductase [Euryarchaeota archaeon]MBT4156763.1 NAD(P)-dependent oxidoreductase [Euryarchaeota archaeon]
MNVAITASDAFVAPFIVEMLGKSAVIIPDEVISDQLKLDTMLTPCNALIHINSRPVESSFERNDRQTKLEMMNAARPILDAVDRHGSLHLIIIGTLRVHPQWEPGEPFYGLDSTLAPRDTAAEGQLWMEENALDRAQTERPVSVIRASNVQGVPLSGPPGNGLLHRWANECQMGWINVPGDGSNPKDFIHVEDLVQVIGGIIQNPPLTREEIAVGSGKGISMHDLANIFQSKTGCEIELNQRDDDEVFGVVDAWVLEERLGFRPRISLEEMIDEAFEAAQ